ncbi:MAG: hypothetical protein JNK85_28975 [Verrucomicrobiales bacterium]|nr:hypothetical protein [Verrucomicrobiales bacterium]
MSDTTIFERTPPSTARRIPDPRIPVPVIRIPVTRSNQARLRALRARELEPWQEAGLLEEPETRKAGFLNPPARDREAHIILLVLAATALAMVVQSTAAATMFVQQWERFQGLFKGVLL